MCSIDRAIIVAEWVNIVEVIVHLPEMSSEETHLITAVVSVDLF